MVLPADVSYRWLGAEAGLEEGEAILSLEERHRLGTLHHPRRRREFLLGRLAARRLLAERLEVAPEAVPLRVAGDGAVDVEGTPYVVSIAHTGGQAVAAVAQRPVGVDLEAIRPRRPDLHRFLLHPDEYALFEALPLDPAEAQILWWTLKEAVLKAMRTGFRCSPKALRVDLDLGAQSAMIRVGDGPGAWTARFEKGAGCFLAVAFREDRTAP